TTTDPLPSQPFAPGRRLPLALSSFPTRRSSDLAFGTGSKGLGAGAGEEPIDRSPAFGVIAFEQQTEVDGKVSTFLPALGCCEEHERSGQDERELWRGVVDEASGEVPGNGFRALDRLGAAGDRFGDRWRQGGRVLVEQFRDVCDRLSEDDEQWG